MAPPDMNDEGEWGQYKRLILAELKRNQIEVQDLNRKFDEFRSRVIAQILVDIAMLKVKAGLWGGLGGLLSALAAFLLWMASSK